MRNAALWAMMVALVGGVITPALEAGAEDGGWKRTLSVGINSSRGNSDTLFSTGSFDAERDRTADMLRFGVRASYGTQDDDTTAREASLSSEYHRKISERFFWLFSGMLEHDAVAELDYRYTAGAGAGYYLIRQEKQKLEAGAALTYVGQKFDDGSKDNYVALQMKERYEVRPNAGMKFWNSLAFLPNVSDVSVFLLRGEAGMEAALNSRLSLRVVVRDEYNSEPAAGLKKNNLTMSTMLSYSF